MNDKCPVNPECELFTKKVSLYEQIYDHDFAVNAVVTQCARIHQEDGLSVDQCPNEIEISEPHYA